MVFMVLQGVAEELEDVLLLWCHAMPRYIIRLWLMMPFHRIILVFWSFGRGYEPRLDSGTCQSSLRTTLLSSPGSMLRARAPVVLLSRWTSLSNFSGSLDG